MEVVCCHFKHVSFHFFNYNLFQQQVEKKEKIEVDMEAQPQIKVKNACSLRSEMTMEKFTPIQGKNLYTHIESGEYRSAPRF